MIVGHDKRSLRVSGLSMHLDLPQGWRNMEQFHFYTKTVKKTKTTNFEIFKSSYNLNKMREWRETYDFDTRLKACG